jgi:hypothetical protein
MIGRNTSLRQTGTPQERPSGIELEASHTMGRSISPTVKGENRGAERCGAECIGVSAHIVHPGVEAAAEADVSA